MTTVPLHETPKGAKAVDWSASAQRYLRENLRLRKALKWYADSENYDTGQDCPDVLIDGGKLAREALSE